NNAPPPPPALGETLPTRAAQPTPRAPGISAGYREPAHPGQLAETLPTRPRTPPGIDQQACPDPPTRDQEGSTREHRPPQGPQPQHQDHPRALNPQRKPINPICLATYHDLPATPVA